MIEILQDWVKEIPTQAQLELLMVLRDCDMKYDDGYVMGLVNYIRKDVLNTDQFTADADFGSRDVIYLSDSIGAYPTSYVKQLITACSILSVYHPEYWTRVIYGDAYSVMSSYLGAAPLKEVDIRRRYDEVR